MCCRNERACRCHREPSDWQVASYGPEQAASCRPFDHEKYSRERNAESVRVNAEVVRFLGAPLHPNLRYLLRVDNIATATPSASHVDSNTVKHSSLHIRFVDPRTLHNAHVIELIHTPRESQSVACYYKSIQREGETYEASKLSTALSPISRQKSINHSSMSI